MNSLRLSTSAAAQSVTLHVISSLSTFLDQPERNAFSSAVGLDDGTWDRARGWALSKGLQVLAHDLSGGTPAADAVRRWGWRVEPNALIEELTKSRR